MNDASDLEEGREIATVESGTVGLIAAAEIDQQIATAHKYPRSLTRFRNEALQMVTLSEVIARECIYALPRYDRDAGENKTIEGPSARFAEIMLHAWGNARAGARVVHEDNEFITAQGVCHDLQRNVAITFEVRRRITTSKGKRYSADMIGVTANAASSIALRNSILKVVPKAFWSEIYTAARKTAIGDVKTLANKRIDAIASFQAYGIDEAKILRKLGRDGVSDITIEDLVTLFGVATAIKEGDITPEEAFVDDGHAATSQGPTMRAAAQPKAAEGAEFPRVAAAQPAAAANEEQQADSGRILTIGQLTILRAKMKRAALTDTDLIAKFGALEEIKASQFDAIDGWIAERAKKNG